MFEIDSKDQFGMINHRFEIQECMFKLSAVPSVGNTDFQLSSAQHSPTATAKPPPYTIHETKNVPIMKAKMKKKENPRSPTAISGNSDLLKSLKMRRVDWRFAPPSRPEPELHLLTRNDQ
jgi:hypothetical protein